MPALLQALNDRFHIGIDEMKPFGTDDFANGDVAYRRFVGDAEIEIPPFRPIPQKKNRPHAEAGGRIRCHDYLQRFS